MSTAVSDIVGQNWTITPAPPGPNEPAPRSFAEQRWVLVLTGVIAYNERTPNGDIVVGIRGNNPHDWRRGGIRIPRLGSVSDAMFAMITRYGVTRPDDTGPLFSLEQWAPFIAVSSLTPGLVDHFTITVLSSSSPCGQRVICYREVAERDDRYAGAHQFFHVRHFARNDAPMSPAFPKLIVVCPL